MVVSWYPGLDSMVVFGDETEGRISRKSTLSTFQLTKSLPGKYLQTSFDEHSKLRVALAWFQKSELHVEMWL